MKTVWIQDPFSTVTTPAFSSDQRTRIVLFIFNLKLEAGETTSAVAVQVEDAQHMVHNLPVEFVGQVPGFDWLTQVVVILTDDLNSGDVQVRITYGGKTSNDAWLIIK